MSTSTNCCPACESDQLRPFFRVDQAPVHSILLIHSQDEALNFPKGTLDLCACEECGFIFNRLFDASLQSYSEGCEETQGFSPTFARFHQELAQSVVDRFQLHHKTVLEIGCGKGEFLEMLCELGPNKGIGFDPAFRPDRLDIPEGMDLRVYQEFFPETYTLETPDFVCCKMTLEHIPDVLTFVSRLRKSLGDNLKVPIFFQMPETQRVLGDTAFWDIYYEHCSYFTKGSLGRLFRRAGFEVKDLWTAYDGQYLMIEAFPAPDSTVAPHLKEGPVGDLLADVDRFASAIQQETLRWKNFFSEGARDGEKTVLWGGGSKAVALLTTMRISDEVQYVVDINPHRQGTFLAGCGQEIVSPEFLKEYQPDRVVIMNAIYVDEITKDLIALGLQPDISTVDPIR
ncbi:MAG: class I SAM-dependent methyltransferase [Verrucomicrobia bacterium]|nr:class I SAM-dependent methyltransferase [Verrucomicrobiota bacterium]